MSYKILTKNGVDNTNIDGARSEYFNTGMRDGIVQGILNEGNLMNNTSNGILFDTCELRIAGHRILIDEPYYKTFENIPNSNIRYSLIAQIIVDDDYNVDFSFLVQTSSTLLRQDNLYANLNGSGIYQVEIGRFTQQSDGIITDIIRTIDVITGASSVDGSGKINIGNVITEKIDYSLNAEVDIDSRYDEEQEKEFVDFKFSLPVDISSEIKNRTLADENLQSQINKKVDNIDGKGLSTNDFTNDYKSQIDSNTSARHTHSNKELLDTYDQTNANIKDAVSKKHSHSNKTLLDTYTQTEANIKDAVDKKHTHSNKTLLDNTTASYTSEEKTKLAGLSNYDDSEVKADIIANANSIIAEANARESADTTLQLNIDKKVDKETGKGLSTNDFTNDYKTQIESNTSARHTHSNKALLDTYTQTETNLADAVSKKHSHSNKSVLDNTTASYTIAEQTKLSGIASGAEVNVQADWNVTDSTSDAYIKNKPTIPEGVKLYSTTGQNTDGAMTQKATTDELNKKLNTSELFDKIYPVDSIYLTVGTTTTGSVSPASFFGGSWERLPEGYALWTASSGAENTIPAGLPNIYGASNEYIGKNSSINAVFGGAFKDTIKTANGWTGYGQDDGYQFTLDFKASNSNAIYGKSTTVQPPAIKVYAWKRVF